MFIGENIKNLRILYGYSQPLLSKETGILENDIWQYENGFKEPSFEHINILKNLFKVRSMYFYQKDLLSGKSSNINVNHISFGFLYD